MASQPPAEVSDLLEATDEVSSRAAWEVFVQKHSRLLMHTARSLGGGYDAALDRYTHILDRLRDNDFKRLRAYSALPNTKFTTWLVVVARRICTDLHRDRYGRERATANPGPRDEHKLAVRKRLADLLVANVDLNVLSDGTKPDPESQVVREEMSQTLDEALCRLSNQDRLLIALRYEDETPAREIAELMGFPSQFHVYRHLKKVLGDLRNTLETQGIDSAGV
ncbi:RNA polymerase sigma factor [Gemmatimonadota bacterium]